MARKALTALTVQKLKPPTSKTARVERYDAAVPGFGVRITAEGSRSWIFVYTSPTKQKRRRYTIGNVEFKTPDGEIALDLDQARTKANDLRRLVREGHDPAIERETTKAAVIAEAQAAEGRTFRAVVELYDKRDLTKKRRGWEVKRIIERELIPLWGDKPIGAITAVDVQERVEALVDADKPEAARRLFEIIRRIFNWVIARPSYKLQRSPADRMKPGELVGKKVKRKRVLTNDELRALWHASEQAGYPFGPMIRTLMLTALRRSEAAEASWSEFDLANREWVIPPDRMKGDASHLVPLTADMVDILEKLPRFTGGFVFTSGDGTRPVSGFSRMKQRLDGFMLKELRKIAEQRGEDPAKVMLVPWTIHDIRRSVRTHLSALPIPEIVRELVLAHARPGLHQVYDQHSYANEKREALELWAKRLNLIVNPPAGNVVALRA
jgi:integrase